MEIALKMQNGKLEQGDIIKIGSSKLPDIEVGDKTLSDEPFEILKAEPDFNAGLINIAGYFYKQMNFVSIGASVLIETLTANTVTFEASDSTTISASDGHYDNSADGVATGTRYIVVVGIFLDQDTPGDGAQSVSYHVRIGTEAGSVITPVSGGDTTYVHNWIAGKFGGLGHAWTIPIVFDGLVSGSYDVSIDYFARSGTDASSIATINFKSATIETDGAAYVELT